MVPSLTIKVNSLFLLIFHIEFTYGFNLLKSIYISQDDGMAEMDMEFRKGCFVEL